MTKIIDRTGKGAAITQSENDANLDSLSGINEPQTGTTYTVDINDQNRTIEFNSSSAVAVTLTQISTIAASLHTSDFKVTLKNIGAGVVTVTPTTDTFDDGDTSKAINQYESLEIQTDNGLTKWNVISIVDYTTYLEKAGGTVTGNIRVSKTTPAFEAQTTSATGSGGYRMLDSSGNIRASCYWNGASSKGIFEIYDATGTTMSGFVLNETGEIYLTGSSQYLNLNGTSNEFRINGTAVTSNADELNVLDSPTAVNVYNPSTTSIADGISQTLDFSSEYEDRNNEHSSGVFTPASSGYYYISGSVVLYGTYNDGGSVSLTFMQGTSGLISCIQEFNDSGNTGYTYKTLQVNKLLYLTSGQAHELKVSNSSGNSLTIDNLHTRTFLTIHRVS